MTNYSHTFLKRQLKMQRFSDCLRLWGLSSIMGRDKQDVFSRTRSRHIYLVENHLLHAISKLPIYV